MEHGYPPHPLQYPNQQQMWANFYSSGGPEDPNGVRYPGPMSPHMGMDGWWQGGPHPGAPHGTLPDGKSGNATGPWTLGHAGSKTPRRAKRARPTSFNLEG